VVVVVFVLSPQSVSVRYSQYSMIITLLTFKTYIIINLNMSHD
jgi:hypothetical protein